MKKLMIAAAIVCAAAMSQAATVNWGGAICDPTGNYAVEAPATAVLIWSSTAFTPATAIEITGLTLGETTNNGGTVVDVHQITTGEANTWVFGDTYAKESASVDGYYAVLIGNAAGTAATYYELSPITGTDGKSSPTDRQVNPSWSSGEYLTSGGYSVNVVPEPTSGLLFLLGVAGLALRRRRA